MQSCKQRSKGGHFCIAPGCTNEFYRLKAMNKTVHFHHLPLTRKSVLLRWLAALKRKNPPVNSNARVCSDHFLDQDYVEEKVFNESGSLVTRRTNRLKFEAAPTIFNFSSYGIGSTDRPTITVSASKVAMRLKRLQRRTHLAEQREVR